jgi:hypothetical protein
MCTTSEMSYKETSKQYWEIMAKYRILRYKLTTNKSNTDVWKYYNTHRNTVSHCIALYSINKTSELHEFITWSSKSLEEIIEKFSFLKNNSRRPLKLRWIAPPEIEKLILDEYRILWYWYRRMYKHLQLRWLLKSTDVWLASMKWLYKRNNLSIKKTRTYNKESKPLYNYSSISPFEYMHMDVKYILDQGGLSKEIYEKFSSSNEIPKFQRTIIDAKTRFRFLAYSYRINSTFWFQFLQFVIMFLRNQRVETKITMWFDWGSEFCSASPKKLAEWNKKLEVLNCVVYQYEWAKDIRKNLIERSHKTDDEEFYNPRWYYINDLESFKKEAKNWYMHFNFTRVHMGIEMGTTPYKKLCASGLWKTKWYDKFPVLILDTCINELMYNTKTIVLRQSLYNNKGAFIDCKSYVDFQVNLNILHNKYAQNVLTPYHQKEKKTWNKIV